MWPAAARRLQPSSALLMTAAVGFRALSQLIILLLITNVCSVQDAAAFLVTMAISGPFFVTADMGLRTIFVASSSTPNFRLYLRARLLAVALALWGTLIAYGLILGDACAGMRNSAH
jgi:hypothetical protein